MNIALIGSDGHCGIYEYSQILKSGFESVGHKVQYLGVPHGDNRRLRQAVRDLKSDIDYVIVEYEPGIFRLQPLVAAVSYIRFVRRVPVLLSVHEIEPAKFPEYHSVQHRLTENVRFGGPRAYPYLAFAAVEVAMKYLSLRVALSALGQTVNRIVVHSPKAYSHIGLITSRPDSVANIPHLIKPQTGNIADLRYRLNLPLDRFLFISPGFVFRRKRILEIIGTLPDDATLLIVGTPSPFEPDYIAEVRERIAASPELDVRLIEDYDRMEDYLMASDAAILYYQDSFQSGIACLALGAGKPCVFSDLPAFAPYREASLVVRNDRELREALQEIRDPFILEGLRQGALRLREEYSPSRVAASYVAATD